jgi:hypothetical protein
MQQSKWTDASTIGRVTPDTITNIVLSLVVRPSSKCGRDVIGRPRGKPVFAMFLTSVAPTLDRMMLNKSPLKDMLAIINRSFHSIDLRPNAGPKLKPKLSTAPGAAGIRDGAGF